MCRVILVLGLIYSAAFLIAGGVRAADQVQTFRKEVKQIMGSAQSQDDARAAALAKARRDAVEEAGIWLESQSVVQNFQLEKDQVTTLATGITQTKVVEEEPYLENGVVGYRVVAEVRVDNSGLGERVRQFLTDRTQVQQAKAIAEREQSLLARLAELERQIASLKSASPEQRQSVRESVQRNSQQLSAQEWYDKGKSLWTTQGVRFTDPALAVEYYSEALRRDPNFSLAYAERGIAYSNLGQPQRAIQDYDRALALNPDAEVYVTRGAAYANLGEHQQAIQDFDRAIRLDPNNAGTYSVRGGEYARLNQPQRAIQDYDRALALNPKDASDYVSRGQTFHTLGQYQRAIQDFDQGIILDATNPQAFVARGLAHGALGQWQRAIQDYDRALALDPKNAGTYLGRGLFYSRLGQEQRAIQDYDRALALNPNRAGTYISRGQSYATLNQYQRAIQDYDQAIRLDPNNALGYSVRGNAYMFTGNVERAIQDYDRAVKLDPNEAGNYFMRGRAYVMLGQRTRAFPEYRQACELGLQPGCDWLIANPK